MITRLCSHTFISGLQYGATNWSTTKELPPFRYRIESTEIENASLDLD